MTTNVDIVNRALQMIGTRTTIASMGESSNEAIQANLVYSAVQDWCLAASNWHFARNVAVLTQVKAVTPPVGTWTTGSPLPPWLFEYSLPADFVRAIYLTDSAHATTNSWDGELKRFSLGTDVISTVKQQVLLTNASPAILVYTQQITDPTLWPLFFERFMVATLAWTLSATLTGDKELVAYMDSVMNRNFQFALQANREQGLVFGDNTPEWLTAVGISYPQRREDNRLPPPQPPANREPAK